jgi:hypothetical protein
MLVQKRLLSSIEAFHRTLVIHSAIGYVTPTDKLAGHEAEIWALRDQRLEAARARRQQRRLSSAEPSPQTPPVFANHQPQPSNFR